MTASGTASTWTPWKTMLCWQLTEMKPLRSEQPFPCKSRPEESTTLEVNNPVMGQWEDGESSSGNLLTFDGWRKHFLNWWYWKKQTWLLHFFFSDLCRFHVCPTFFLRDSRLLPAHEHQATSTLLPGLYADDPHRRPPGWPQGCGAGPNGNLWKCQPGYVCHYWQVKYRSSQKEAQVDDEGEGWNQTRTGTSCWNISFQRVLHYIQVFSYLCLIFFCLCSLVLTSCGPLLSFYHYFPTLFIPVWSSDP